MAESLKRKIEIHKGLTLWLTGLSGAGKSTIAQALVKKINEINKNQDKKIKYEVLDGDALREHINKDLKFTKEDRMKNICRVAYIASLLSKHGVLTIVPVIAPYKEGRDLARSLSENFLEVFVKADIETVKARDVKGLYKKALAGEIDNFTGISDPYEEPENPDILINTDEMTVDQSVEEIIKKLLV